MIGLAILALAAVLLWLSVRYFDRYGREDIASPKTSARLNRLWGFVDKATKQGRQRAIERALLAILRIDHKNTAAYNRLGVLYAKQGNFDDAIDCFAIASSLTPTVATLYNLGLVQYEKGNYREAANAFERVVDLEPNVKRLVAYAKALSKLGNIKKVAEVLEEVVEMDPSAEHHQMLAQAYSQLKEHAKAEESHKQAAVLRSRQLAKLRRVQTKLPRLPGRRPRPAKSLS